MILSDKLPNSLRKISSPRRWTYVQYNGDSVGFLYGDSKNGYILVIGKLTGGFYEFYRISNNNLILYHGGARGMNQLQASIMAFGATKAYETELPESFDSAWEEYAALRL